MLFSSLPKPFFALAPMADVTDVSFRQMFVRHGRPYLLWTEFVSADGLFLAPFNPKWKELPDIDRVQEIADICYKHGVSRNHPLILDLVYLENEHPIIVQFFSTNPERMEKAAKLGKELGFDGIDLNMGCPADIICAQGSGSAMINTPDLAKEVILSTLRGAEGIPVSVKTRVGYHEPSLESWAKTLLSTPISALTIHARTRKEMSKVPARWEFVKDAVQIRDKLAPEVIIIGNGDVVSVADGLKRQEEVGCDGVMIGRGIFGNPWIFTDTLPTPEEKIAALREHAGLFAMYLGKNKSFALMKKHVKSYLSGIDGSHHLKDALMSTTTAEEFEDILLS